jgi:riboflavin kinase/FMN adenylyltransferase
MNFRVVRDMDELPAGLRFVTTVGVFDGMHRGHRQVLETLIRSADRLNSTSVALTFDPHPEKVVRGRAPVLLCDPDERVARLRDAGVGLLVLQHFDEAFRQQSAEAFLDRLRRGRDLRGLVMSAESAFGHDRAGTIDTVRRLAGVEGWQVIEVPTLEVGGARVSSGRIRELVQVGRLAGAGTLMGRRYAVIGEVVHGDARGRTLGFPTANLAFEEPVCLPPNGIYATRVSWDGPDPLQPLRRADGVASLGVRPQFGGGERLLEVHLLDFDGDLYGTRLRIEFVRRQRGEHRFRSVDALVAQMRRDVVRTRTILERA